MKAKKAAQGGFKTQLGAIERTLKKTKKELKKLYVEEKRARVRWTKGYGQYIAAAEQIADLTLHGTKREASLRQKIKGWPKESASLTRERDKFRAEISKSEESLIALGIKLAIVSADELSQSRATDEVVTEVFSLNEVVVRAASSREDYLKRQIFTKLIDEDGQLRRQVTFDSANGLRRVVALVNVMTIVRSDLAAEAKRLIGRFFERFQQPAKLDPRVGVLFELTRQLLVTKTDFKVGPDLYRFLAAELDSDVFPELFEAQALLRQSIRSEKTSSYIRLYVRTSRADKWTPVPQS